MDEHAIDEMLRVGWKKPNLATRMFRDYLRQRNSCAQKAKAGREQRGSANPRIQPSDV